jgi:cytochrome c biogenesis protein
LIRYLITFLTSTKVGIGVMAILAVLSLMGATIPQGAAGEAYTEIYGRFWGGLVWHLGLSDVFRAGYFTGLLVLLCVMVFACSLRRLPQKVRLARGKRFIFEEAGLAGLPQQHEITVDVDQEEAALHVVDICKHRLYGVSRTSKGRVQALFASKMGFSRYGSFILHLSFIFLLVGAVANTGFGSRSYRETRVGEGFPLEVSPGDSVRVDVDDFTVETDERDRLSDYLCEVTVSQDRQVLLRYEIRPNHPLRFRGKEVFLVSYAEDDFKPEGFVVTVYDSTGGTVAPHVFVPLGDAVRVDEVGGSLRATLGVVPGVQLISDDGGVRTYLLRRDVASPGEAGAAYQFVFMYAVPALIVTLEVVDEPFQGFIVAGLSLLSAGTFVSLYLSHRRIWFIVTGLPQDKARIAFGGSSNRNPVGMADELEGIRKTLDELA